MGPSSFFLTTCCTNVYCTFAAVKWLTIILSVYFLGLSLWPCADKPLLPVGQSGIAMILSASTTESDTGHHHEHDACTPFCTCACCAATIAVAPRFQYSPTHSVKIVPIVVATFNYASDHPFDPITAIWQPPQLRV